MSTSSAKAHASKALRTSDTSEKLDEIARAIYELARTISDIEDKTDKIK